VGSLADVDPLAVTRSWLLSRQRVTEVVGERVGPYNEPPYPCVVLSDPPGNDRDLTHLIAPLVQIEVLGDPDGSPGKPVLRRVLYIVLEELALLRTKDFGPGEAVVTNVGSTGGGGWSPMPTGQPRYLATVALHMHPATTPVT
jgi:hypothetical protein